MRCRNRGTSFILKDLFSIYFSVSELLYRREKARKKITTYNVRFVLGC